MVLHSLVCVFDPVVNSLLCKPELPRLKVAYKQAAVHVSCRDVTVIHRFSSYIMTTLLQKKCRRDGLKA